MPGNETLMVTLDSALIDKLDQIAKLTSSTRKAVVTDLLTKAVTHEVALSSAGTPAAPSCDNPDHPDPALKSYYQEGDTTAPSCDGSGRIRHSDGYGSGIGRCKGCPLCAASEVTDGR